MIACPYHCITTRDLCFLSVTSQRTRSDCVAMYCATVFCICQMYVSIISNPASSLSASAEVYSHFLSARRCGSLPVSHCVTWSWRPPRTRPMRGVITHVSVTKSSTDLKAALKKNPDTRSLYPSLLRILVILLHNARTFSVFRTTSGPSPSTANITRSPSQGGAH